MQKLTAIDEMQHDKDEAGLIRVLRSAPEVEIRARAAQALGKIGELSATESLIRSYFQDPSVDVQTAAYNALEWMLGSETQTALSAYLVPEDPWFIENVPEQSQPEEIWNDNDIEGLIATLRVDQETQKQLKAIQGLSQIEDTRAIDALASIALWSEKPELRQAAYAALENIYGDNLEEVLQSYREASPNAELQLDDESAEDTYKNDSSSTQTVTHTSFETPAGNQNGFYLGIILLFLVVLAIYLLTR